MFMSALNLSQGKKEIASGIDRLSPNGRNVGKLHGNPGSRLGRELCRSPLDCEV